MNSPSNLHVIGLTGGIATGKSSVREFLAKFPETALIDADLLGHDSYLPGTDCYRKLIQEFGSEIIKPSDRTIDRVKLGAIVFANPVQKLKRLNEIVWPEIKALAVKKMKQYSEAASSSNLKFIIFEAAVLIEAGWTDIVDEIWVELIHLLKLIQASPREIPKTPQVLVKEKFAYKGWELIYNELEEVYNRYALNITYNPCTEF